MDVAFSVPALRETFPRGDLILQNEVQPRISALIREHMDAGSRTIRDLMRP